MYFCIVLFFLFFFFKQKTAYEMRISDWSSDVCSSDLLRVAARNADVGPQRELHAGAEAVAMYRRNHRKRQLAPADAETLKRIRERPPQLQVQREGLCLVRHHGLDIEPGAERRSVGVANRAPHNPTRTEERRIGEE